MPITQVRVVPKPWGHEEIFAANHRYVGKVLFVRAGEALSLQYHRQKDETLRILEGDLELLAGPSRAALEAYRLRPGDAFHIPPGTIHRMIAHADTRILEVSTPELDDVVRLEDRYGREGSNEP